MSSLLNQKIPNENDLVKLKKEHPYLYQMAGEHAATTMEGRLQKAESMPGLVALHNLTVDNLKKAIDLGGLAVPSIPITKKQSPYNFGSSDGVTLIMDESAVDPTKMPVYSRDAWTQIFPAIVRTGNKEKIVKYVEDTIIPAEKEISREIIDHGNLYTPSTSAKPWRKKWRTSGRC